LEAFDLRIPLAFNSEVPLYKQITAYFCKAIEQGHLPPDTRLPASRQLAADLGVSRITVDNAYAELVALGCTITRPGSGTYVLAPAFGAHKRGPCRETPLWQQQFASTELTIIPFPTSADLISFAGGCGDPKLFPVDDFRKTLTRAMQHNPQAALDYGDPAGYRPLRETVTQVLSSQGLEADSCNVLITAGSQQAISLVAQVLLRPRDVILVESPTYAKALDLFRALDLSIVSIPTDHSGMQTHLLEDILRVYHPRLIYTIPNFQNPSGACLDSRRRRELVELAARYNVPILEDDFVGDLRYEGSAQPSLKSLDQVGGVIYVSTFSKMLLPGLRIGFAIAEGPVYQALLQRKQLQDLATSNLIQRALHSYIDIGRYQAHLRRSCKVYRRRLQVLLEAMRIYVPSIQITPPQGGLFAWGQLPDSVSADKLLEVAHKVGVSYATGAPFCADNSGRKYIRLNFASLDEAQVTEGVRRLGLALTKFK